MRYAGGIRKDREASCVLETAKAHFAFGRYQMAEIHKIGNSNEKGKDLKSEIKRILNEASQNYGDKKNTVYLKKSCMMLIFPENLVNKLIG